ncbi:MAG: DUF4189 domain-containing protein [Xanthobacteraceae bacterium]
MGAIHSARRRTGARAHSVAWVLLGAVLWPHLGAAEGALAVGVPDNVAKKGFAYGYSNNKASPDEARATALDGCRKPGPSKPSEAVRSLCMLIANYHDQCVAVAMDPGAGTPGVGWAVSPSLEQAQGQAIANCKSTAGTARREFCVVDKSACDGTAK